MVPPRQTLQGRAADYLLGEQQAGVVGVVAAAVGVEGVEVLAAAAAAAPAAAAAAAVGVGYRSCLCV